MGDRPSDDGEDHGSSLSRAFARDHSTVINACRVVTIRLRQDLGFALLVNRLALDLRSAAVPAV